MAYEAVESLQQSLLLILQRHDHLTTRHVKQRIISIHTKAVVLQLNLKHFPEKETIMEVVNTTEEIIEYLFSPQKLSDCESTDPTIRLLGKLAEEIDSTVGCVVDYCKSNAVSYSPADSDSSSSRSTLKSQVEDLTVATELVVKISNRLRRLAVRIESTAIELVDEDPIDPPSISPLTSKDVVVSFNDNLSDSAAVTSKDVVVGFYEDMQQIMDRLVRDDTLEIRVIPIVGMGGIGKSTLAKIVYDNQLIKQHFYICAWVTLRQDYSIQSVLSILLASLKGKLDLVGRDSLKATKEVELEISEILSERLRFMASRVEWSAPVQDSLQEIYKILWGRRFLTVMDGIWSLTDIRNRTDQLFPDNLNGSRIMLTTRLKNVAAVYEPVHMMHFLDDEQSWRLFQHKVFGDQDCPLELQTVGEKIVKGCGGLPLSIVTVARLLSMIPRTPKLWQQIEANAEQLGSVLSLSYNHLSLHLRKCFLYMAAFPQGYEIRASELIKLWVAEDFLKHQIYRFNSETVEEEAERNLEDLVNASLVLVTSRKIDGKIKRCRLHSMVRDFCVRQAGEEKFLLSVMDYFPTPILRRHFLPQVLQNHHRISVSWHDLHLRDFTHSSCTTSIICFPQRGFRPKGSVENFTSLKVLHVLRKNDHSYWELGQVFGLIDLTYLASNIPDSIVPPAISKPQNLQTLIICRSEVRLPVEIWSLRQLRHLIAFSFCPLLLPEGVTIFLENLQTFSMATNFVCSERMVKVIPSIKKLGICYSRDEFGSVYHLDNLIHLLQLEKLKLEVHSSFVLTLDNHGFPLSLKKLELNGEWISWSRMTIVGSLPNLQVLKLKNYACYGRHWETNNGEFVNLRLLLIDKSNLKCWRTDRSHFPSLLCLMLYRCPYLDEIPKDIANIQALELIEIDDHNHSLLHSAKIIQEEQREVGSDHLKVVVKRS
ncbi:putative late blight resistance protein homolog R1B-16 [Salvia splendens]|uniref:putative late blight resistance protein homolog R1B-16 n=1 Tax=Salvia splendens TaxID=180675 RepID=UPI001C2752A6|nr:putative late blight resistance protein homolog R1B-16 [Salvia splendens]